MMSSGRAPHRLHRLHAVERRRRYTRDAFVYLVDGDFDLAGTQPIPSEKPTSFLLLQDRPDLSQPVTISTTPDAADRRKRWTRLLTRMKSTPPSLFDHGQHAHVLQKWQCAVVSGTVRRSYAFIRPGYTALW
jgi:hypothetical protein